MSPTDRETFWATGLLSLKRRIPQARLAPARDAILAELGRLRLRENGKWHLKKLDGVSPFQVATKIAQNLVHQPAFDDVVPPDLVASLATLAGTALDAQPRPQILVTPPQKDDWSIPAHGWHVDVTRPSANVIPGIQIFVLLDDVAPRGGATVAIVGSHLAPETPPTPENVLEMSGQAGDVFLMDMRIRHAPSVNATKRARLMLTSRFLRS